MSYFIKTIRSQEGYADNPDYIREKNDLQDYIDREKITFSDNAIGLIPIRGIYTHRTRKLTLIVVIVSTYDTEIKGVGGVLRTKLQGYPAKVLPMQFGFPEEYIGVLKKNEAFLVHFNIPTEGLEKDTVIRTRDLECSLENVKIIIPTEEEKQ